MTFVSTPELRSQVVTACKVLHHFRIVEGFGHISVRLKDRMMITPRKALGLVSEDELVELDLDGKQVAGKGSPPLEWPMHMAVYARRPDVMSIARGHPRNVAAYACAGEPLRVAHGFGANLTETVNVFEQPFLVANAQMGEGVADALDKSEAVILQSNGMLAVGQSIGHACVQALFLEETAELQLKAHAAGFTPRFYSPQGAERRHGDDRVNEPIRAWDYYVAVALGRV